MPQGMVCLLKGSHLVIMQKTILGVAVLAPLAPEANKQKSLIKRAPHQQIVYSDRCISQLSVTKVTECVYLTVCHW